MRALVTGVRDKAAKTPAGRERHVDLLRAAAICVVVIGHWLAIAVVYDDGELGGVNALHVLTWAHPLTWVVQVMPIFFLVGGFANGASLSSHLESGGDSVSWLHSRTDRLLRPVTVLFLVVPAVAIVAVLAGVPEDLVGTATWLTSIPLWFLLAYLAMVVLAPWMYALHRRAGLAVPLVLVAWVAVADLLRIGFEVPVVGESTFLVGWLAVHQLGFCWRDGRVPAGGLPAMVWTLAALAVLLALTVAGPYGIRMVGVNTDPPTLALMALAATQAGVVFLLRPSGSRWLQRLRPWTVVVGLNAVVLTLFVWHMTAAVIAAVALFPTGVLPQPEVDSGAWLLWRIPWVAACALVLAVLVAMFAPIELRTVDAEQARAGVVRDVLTALGVVAVLGGLLGVALAGRDYHGWGGLPPLAVLSYLGGAAVLRVVRSGWLQRNSRMPG
ncbi:MAG TPA: acyltransferase [Jiangellaceae bacterium]|nr:acyltransferase [Jiangellaceae bacterium]